MQRRQFLTLGASLPFWPLSALAQTDEFEVYKQQELQAFSDYETALNQAFAAYKQLYETEFVKYKKTLSTRWRDPEVSAPTKWVTYDETLAHKLVIDYEKGEVRIESVTPPSGQQRAEINEMIRQLNRADLFKLVDRDPMDHALNDFTAEENIKLNRLAGSLVAEKSPTISPKYNPVQLNQTLPRAQIVTTSQGQNLTRYVMPLSAKQLNQAEQRYLLDVNQQAKRWQIEPSLVMAIAKCESAFNPLAKSHVPAFGLMQIVPRSAGLDASKLIYGEPRLVSPSYLYTPRNNLQMGSAYLHILHNRYFNEVKDPQSRLYCAIAAYNTGPGNVARAFTGSTKLTPMYDRINQMSSTRVHGTLLNNLPYDETKNYLRKVLAAKQSYQNLS